MPNHSRAGATHPRTPRTPQPLPGLPAALVIAAITTLGVGVWAQARLPKPATPAAPDINSVAEVAPQDIPAAIETIDAPADQLAKLKTREACKTHLAWITIRSGPGQPAGRIRLQSGQYLSPAFTLTDVPVRVALPYPAPYPTGRGTISVLGTTTDAIIALTPPWRVATQSGVQALDVTWTPVNACPAAKT